jgi:hypothetical protein
MPIPGIEKWKEWELLPPKNNLKIKLDNSSGIIYPAIKN